MEGSRGRLQSAESRGSLSREQWCWGEGENPDFGDPYRGARCWRGVPRGHGRLSAFLWVELVSSFLDPGTMLGGGGEDRGEKARGDAVQRCNLNGNPRRPRERQASGGKWQAGGREVVTSPGPSLQEGQRGGGREAETTHSQVDLGWEEPSTLGKAQVRAGSCLSPRPRAYPGHCWWTLPQWKPQLRWLPWKMISISAPQTQSWAQFQAVTGATWAELMNVYLYMHMHVETHHPATSLSFHTSPDDL
jgi:hypothetical protein